MPESFIKGAVELASASFWAFFAAVTRMVLSPSEYSVYVLTRKVIIAIFVATTVSYLLQDIDFGEGTKSFIIIMCAFISDDILRIVLTASMVAHKRSESLIGKIIDKSIKDITVD